MLSLLGAIGVVAAVGMIASIRDDKAERQTPVAATTNFKPAPQPPGPTPAGKVWSVEHGHWHDAAPAAQGTAPAPIIPVTPVQQQPPGPAPAGKVWSPEHGHWHDAPKP